MLSAPEIPMRLVLVSLLLLLPGLLVSTPVAAQEPMAQSGQRMRVTTIRFERGPRFNASDHQPDHPVVVTEQVPSQTVAVPTPAQSGNHIAVRPVSVLVDDLATGGFEAGQGRGAGQVGYQQLPNEEQVSPSDFQLELRRQATDDPAEVIVDSRYETLDYRDPRYPYSEYGFIVADQSQADHLRTPIGFCEYHHKNNPFCAHYKRCGGTPGCCDEWADFCPCYGLSRFRYICKKDCFYGKTGCRARHAYRHGKWVQDEEENPFGCPTCNVR